MPVSQTSAFHLTRNGAVFNVSARKAKSVRQSYAAGEIPGKQRGKNNTTKNKRCLKLVLFTHIHTHTPTLTYTLVLRTKWFKVLGMCLRFALEKQNRKQARDDSDWLGLFFFIPLSTNQGLIEYHVLVQRCNQWESPYLVNYPSFLIRSGWSAVVDVSHKLSVSCDV